MAELQERDAKLIQYLNEAYGKEKELETALQGHVKMTSRAAYKKRLQDHLKETKQQATGLQRRIKQLGGKAAKGPLHAVRGTSEPEKMLKNAKTEYCDEAEEIANYNAIQTLAEALGDTETAKLARDYRRQEERMSKFLERTIPQLTKEVVKLEIPASQRTGGRRTPRSGSSRSSGASRAASPRTTSSSRAAKATAATAGRTSRSSASKRSSPSRRSGSSRSGGSGGSSRS